MTESQQQSSSPYTEEGLLDEQNMSSIPEKWVY
jgi:hypothetical protein